jgi:hypothetical protein
MSFRHLTERIVVEGEAAGLCSGPGYAVAVEQRREAVGLECAPVEYAVVLVDLDSTSSTAPRTAITRPSIVSLNTC